MRPALVIVPCGGAKLTRPAPAAQLYIGPYHRKAAAAARAVWPGALAPLHGGMGYQMQQMVRISQTGRIAP